jgi:1-acyl-sn-glycerol-3-phosphate acyltransferase
MYDVSLLTEVFRAHQPRFISKKELAKLVPAVSYIARNNKTALIDRKNRAQALAEIKKVSESTKNDKAAIIVFPEGTRARDGQIKPFKVGGLQTILEAIPDAIIVPIAITNSWKILKNNLLPIPDGIYLTVQSLPIIKWEKQFQTNEEIQLFINSIQKQISDAVS